MANPETDQIDWIEPSRELLQRWVELEKLASQFVKGHIYERSLAAGMLQELLPMVTYSPEQFNGEYLNLIYEEVKTHLKSVCKINQISVILNKVAEAARWVNEGKTTDVVFSYHLPMVLAYFGMDGSLISEFDLVDEVHNIFPQYTKETEAILSLGREEGNAVILEMFSGEIYLRNYKQSKSPEIPTRFPEVFLALDYKDAFGLPQLAIRVKPI